MLKINAKFSPEKIKVEFNRITCLGFVVDKFGYRPKENQLEKFVNAPFPTREKLRNSDPGLAYVTLSAISFRICKK